MNFDKVEAYFTEYERDFQKLDIKAIAEHYAENFLSAGPKGVIANNKKEFIEKADQFAQYYRDAGQKSARLISKTVIPISNEYCLVTVHWGAKFEKLGNKEVEFDVSYLLQELNGELQVILFISHEDEEKTMKELGLI
jgi:hypothetical protein